MNKKHFFYVISIYIFAIFYLASSTPISPHEANIYYNVPGIVSLCMHLGEYIVGGFLGLRIVFILFGLWGIWLFYRMSHKHFIRQTDVYLATAIFMILPGIITGISLANVSIIVLPLVLLFVLLYEAKKRLFLPFLMFALFFIHEASILFFIALLIYGLIHKDKPLMIGASTFLGAFIYLAKGIEIGGRPSGHFLEIFGLYATVFSPLLFLYFFYAMYRILLREKKTLLWYISFTALAFSFLLSIRQRVYITDFAPYVMISVLLMLDTLNHSVRVRLPAFQIYYNRAFYIVIFFLLISASVIFFHKQLYQLSTDPNTHFAKRIYEPYRLAKTLKSQSLSCAEGIEGREVFQLRYYNIAICPN